MYALIEFSGKQFRVKEGDSIKVPYIDIKVGSKISIEKILYLDDGKKKIIGNPIIQGMKISSQVESHTRDRKIVVFKFKRRKGHQKKNTHRQEYSLIKIGKLSKTTTKSTGTSSKVSETPKKAAPKKAAPKTKLTKE